MSRNSISARALRDALALRDLTDPSRGPHAMQMLIDALIATLAPAWGSLVRVVRSLPIVEVTDNYDALHYSPAAVARDARYTRYVSDAVVLRTHTTAMIPPELRKLDAEASVDTLIAAPGV
jgi:phenylalanyl-tRNA synthetase alpha chain